MINKENMTEPVEIEKLLVKKIQTSEEETNTDPVELSETIKVEESSNNQDLQEMKTPYHHPN